MILVAYLPFLLSSFFWTGGWISDLMRDHYVFFVGVPFSAIVSYVLVSVLETTRGRIEFEVVGLKFKGASPSYFRMRRRTKMPVSPRARSVNEAGSGTGVGALKLKVEEKLGMPAVTLHMTVVLANEHVIEPSVTTPRLSPANPGLLKFMPTFVKLVGID